MVKVSIIVPIYNVEPYLKRCIDSIINQTLSHIEIILVDDGTLDNSGTICDEYQKNHSHIKVIHQENKGLSMARNAGIDIAVGEYLGFIDGDDYIESDMFSYLYNHAKQDRSDICCCGHTDVYENGMSKVISAPNIDAIYSNKEALDLYLFTKYIDVITCNKIFKKELFKDIKFPAGKLYEDMYTIYKLIDKANQISYHSDSKYNYCKRSVSIGGQKFSSKTLKLLEACDEVYTFTTHKYPDCKNIKIGRLQWYIVVINKMVQANEIDMNLVKKTRKIFRKSFFSVLGTTHIDFIRKVQLLLFLVNMRIYKKVYIKYIKKNR